MCHPLKGGGTRGTRNGAVPSALDGTHLALALFQLAAGRRSLRSRRCLHARVGTYVPSEARHHVPVPGTATRVAGDHGIVTSARLWSLTPSPAQLTVTLVGDRVDRRQGWANH